MYYLIDGYNFLFRLANPKNMPFAKKRDQLIQECQKLIAQTSLKITLIFDARTDKELFARTQQLGELSVIFTAGQTADDWILEFLACDKKQKPYCVVTADRLLADSARLLGAKTLNIDEFFKLIDRKQNAESFNKEPPKEMPFPAGSFMLEAYLKRLLKLFESRYDKDLDQD